MPDDENLPAPDDRQIRSGNKGGSPADDTGIAPSEICHLGIGRRASANATIHVVGTAGEKFTATELPGEHSWILRDAFNDAVRSYIGDDLQRRLLSELTSKPPMRLEIACEFPDPAELGDDAIAQRIAFSAAVMLKADVEELQCQALTYDAAWVSARGQDASGRTYFEYCLAVCHDVSAMEELVRKYQEVQQERQRIDAERDAWVQAQAQPLLDELRDQLLTSSMPEIDREVCKKMLDELVTDAYFRNIVDAKQASEMLGLDVSRVRELGREGRFGKRLSTGFIHAIEDIRHFMSKPRETGKHRKS